MLRAEDSTSQHQGSSSSSSKKSPSDLKMGRLKKMYPDMDKRLVFAPLLPERVRDNPIAEELVGGYFFAWLRETGLKGILWKELTEQRFCFFPSLGSEANVLVADFGWFNSQLSFKKISERAWREYWEKDLQRVIENEWKATGANASFEKITQIRYIHIGKHERIIACLEQDLRYKVAKNNRVLDYSEDWFPLVYREGAVEFEGSGDTEAYICDDDQEFKEVFEAFIFFEDDKQYVSELSTVALEEFNWSQIFSDLAYQHSDQSDDLPSALNNKFPNLSTQMELISYSKVLLPDARLIEALLVQTKSTGIVCKVQAHNSYFAKITSHELRPCDFNFLYNSQLGSICLISSMIQPQQLDKKIISLFENHVRLQFLLPLVPHLKHVSFPAMTEVLKNINFLVIADSPCHSFSSTETYNELSENMEFSSSWFLSRLLIASREGSEPFKFYKPDNELKLQECNDHDRVFGNKPEKVRAERTDVPKPELIITALISLCELENKRKTEKHILRAGKKVLGEEAPDRKRVRLTESLVDRHDLWDVSDLKRSKLDPVAEGKTFGDTEKRTDDFKLSHLLLKESMLEKWEKQYKSGNDEERIQYLLSVKHYVQKEVGSNAEKQIVLEVLKSVAMQHFSTLTSTYLQGLSAK